MTQLRESDMASPASAGSLARSPHRSAKESNVAAPALANIHHYSPTVSDVEASAAWYERVLGLSRVPAPFPHWGDEEGGYAVVLAHPAGFLAFGVASRADLDAWTAWLDECGIAHSGVQDLKEPMPLQTVVFKDPDGIPLELFFMDS
jgi:catechol 2,3-dioxygenase-like lactoylglutathione lyase family enzyme